MRYDRFKHHRRSIRMKGWDYTRPGVFYVTICTKGQICLFGEVTDGRMHMNNFGRIVEDAWNALEFNYVYVRLDEYKIMPNHFHGIVIYDRMAAIVCRCGSRTAPIMNTGNLSACQRAPQTVRINIVYGA